MKTNMRMTHANKIRSEVIQLTKPWLKIKNRKRPNQNSRSLENLKLGRMSPVKRMIYQDNDKTRGKRRKKCSQYRCKEYALRPKGVGFVCQVHLLQKRRLYARTWARKINMKKVILEELGIVLPHLLPPLVDEAVRRLTNGKQ